MPARPILHFAAVITSRLTRLVAAALLALLITPRPTQSQCGSPCSPPSTPPCLGLSNSNIPDVVVGSPSGQARPYTVSLTPVSGVMITETWLSYTQEFFCMPYPGVPTPYTLPSFPSSPLECFEEGCEIIFWPYQFIPGSSGTFQPRFGGDTTKVLAIDVQYRVTEGPGYASVECVLARSTDFDADGDTDQLDKMYIGRHIASGSPPEWCNLNTESKTDTVIDASDYMIVVNEMLRAVRDSCDCPPNTTNEEPTCHAGPTTVADNAAPDATTLSTTQSYGCCVGLSWQAPGDDYLFGVAKEFDLRYSPNPITAANFNSATRYTAVPSPGIAGTVHSILVDACALNAKYWAIKTADHAQTTNWSAISNVVNTNWNAAAPTVNACGAFKNCVLISWTSPGGNDQVWYSTSPITNCSFGSGTLCAVATSQPNEYHEQFINGLSQGTTYYFAAKTQDGSGAWSQISNGAQIRTRTTGVSCNYNIACAEGLPLAVDGADGSFALAMPVPNPAQDEVVLRYTVPDDLKGQTLDLSVFDVAGRRVATVVEGTSQPGRFEAKWSLGQTSVVRSGVFFVRLRVGEAVLRRRVVVGP